MGTTKTIELADRIDQVREQAGVSVLELSKRSAIPLTTLQRYLKNADNLTVPQLGRLSEALNVSVSSWFV